MEFDVGSVMWWGYLHSSGSIQVKRYLGDPRDYNDDCEGNPFVVEVVSPFAAASREEATAIITAKLKGVQA